MERRGLLERSGWAPSGAARRRLVGASRRDPVVRRQRVCRLLKTRVPGRSSFTASRGTALACRRAPRGQVRPPRPVLCITSRVSTGKRMGPGGPPGLQNRSLPACAGGLGSTPRRFRQIGPCRRRRCSRASSRPRGSLQAAQSSRPPSARPPSTVPPQSAAGPVLRPARRRRGRESGCVRGSAAADRPFRRRSRRPAAGRRGGARRRGLRPAGRRSGGPGRRTGC